MERMPRKRALSTPLALALLVATSGLVLPLTAAADSPSVVLTFVPQHGSYGDLAGRTWDVDPATCSVAVYIYGDGFGWWTKPSQASPKVPIRPDSTWTCDITTGGNDRFAIGIRAYLWPNSLGSPPFAGGTETLWSWMDTLPHCDTVRPTRRIVVFRGDTWCVKTSDSPVGPGPNYFSDSTANVWLDSAGQMHLRITHRSGSWWCPEVYRKHPRGYGPYVFGLTGPLGRLDPNVVLGLFTWDNWPAPPYQNNLHREIDVEFSRWGLAGDTNAQYVVQPWSGPGNRFRWWLPSDVDSSTHSFNWSGDSIRFLSVRGHRYAPPYDSVFRTLLYTGPDVPNVGTETPHMNLWLLNGTPPSNDSEVEVIVARFETSFVNVGLRPREPAHQLLEHGRQNPTRSLTSIAFKLPSAGHVVLKAYDALARERAVLVNGSLPAGRHEVNWRADGLPCGVYMLRFQADGATECSTVTLLQ